MSLALPVMCYRRRSVSVVAASNGLLTGLEAYYKLEEASGTRVDSHSNGYDLTTIVNAPGNTAGKSGNAIDLDGTMYAQSVAVDPLDGTNKYSYCGWYRWNSFIGHQAMFSSFDVPEYYFLMYSSSSTVIRMYTPGVVPTTVNISALSTATWYHVGMVYNGDLAAGERIQLYVNGSPTAASTTSTGSSSGSSTIAVGYSTNGAISKLNGDADEVALWSRALDDDDFTLLYNSGSGTFYDDFS